MRPAGAVEVARSDRDRGPGPGSHGGWAGPPRPVLIVRGDGGDAVPASHLLEQRLHAVRLAPLVGAMDQQFSPRRAISVI